MKSWRKPLIEIITVVILFSLIAEVILGLTLGYDTYAQGELKFKDGLEIDGEIEYNVDFFKIGGENWTANFSNISNVHITYNNRVYQIQTTYLVIEPNGDGYVKLYGLLNNSKFSSIHFLDRNEEALLSIPENRINGVIRNTSESNALASKNVIFITENEVINASPDQGSLDIYGVTEEILFNISTEETYRIKTYLQKGDVIHLNGDLHGHNFEGTIHSKGRIYFSGDPKLSGNMGLEILQTADVSGIKVNHEDYWELSIEGEFEVVEGFGFPYWSFGLMLSSIPSVIIIAYHINKKILKEKKKLQK